MRILKTPNEFIDLISSMSGRKFVTFGYVSGANLNIPQHKVQNPKTGRMINGNDMSAFRDQLGVDQDIAGILKLSRYNLRFMNREDFTNAYAKFNKSFDELKVKYDYPESNRKSNGNYTQKVKFGKGVDVYKGDREDLQGKTYIKQDITGARVKSTYYLMDPNGFIIRTYTKKELTQFLMDMSKPEPGVIAMRKLGRDEAKIQEYIKEFGKIKLIPKSFEYNQILYMVGTANKEKFLYINHNLINVVKDVECEIDTDQFVNIAKELYKDSFIDLEEYANNPSNINEALQIFDKSISIIDKKALYESIMRTVSREVKKALNESYKDKKE